MSRMHTPSSRAEMSRREFLHGAAVAGTAVAVAAPALLPGADLNQASVQPSALPWFRRVLRWGQTNITERDPTRYDIAWWREQWRRTQVQGVIINAGGIVAYYPSRIPFHRSARFLGDRDLFGELCRAAHQDGLAVFARMDSSRAHEDCFQAHPDWFARDASDQPYRAGDQFTTCVNSPYYEVHLPSILREIIERYHPEGFTDNSWSGLGRGSVCHCQHCVRVFRERTGLALPTGKNWNDSVYRQWIKWNYQRRIEIWEFNNRVTQQAGGPECIWAGMNSGSVSGQSQSFRDLREICRRAPIIMLDHQARNDATGFQDNAEAGKLIHGMLGWDKLVPESMAMYQAGKPTFRFAAKPAPEARLWMVEGFAGGIQPWWHHVGAYHEDRRMYRTAEPLCRWHREHQQMLIDRQPVATVGLVWSQTNLDFYGRDDAEVLVELPQRGMAQALIRSRIPYLPVHADQIAEMAGQFSLLILPNLAAMPDSQIDAVRRFVQRGGNLLSSGQTSLFDEWGDPRPNYGLADLFGAHLGQGRKPPSESARRQSASETSHSYLRLDPELRAGVDGPHIADEPPARGQRHPVLRGFDETDILAFGGTLEPLELEPNSQALMTFIPSFPIYPPETSWMREPRTGIPGLILNTTSGGSRIAFLPADLDRRFARDHLPDHGNLLANLIRWAAKDQVPLTVQGQGLIDCHLYQRPGRLILHLVNLTNVATWRQPVDELIPVGPFHVRLRLPKHVLGKRLELLVSGLRKPSTVRQGWSHFEIDRVLDHEVAVVS